LVVVRELSQIGMPPPCNVKSAKFSFKFKPRNPLAPIRIQMVDENYRIWRGKAVSLNRASGRKETFAVYDMKAQTNRLVSVDSSRIVKLAYRFDSSHADAYYPPVWKDIPIVGGGGAGLLSGFGCGNSRRYGHGVAVGKFALNSGENSNQTAPRLVREKEGFTALDFDGSSFASMPLQAIPIYAGFEVRMKLMPMRMDGEEGLIDSGNQGFQLYLDKGVPSAFVALGNLIAERGVNETQGVTVYGPKLKRNEWNELVYRFDQRHAWIEVNGVAGEKKPCMGYMSNADVAAIGVAIKSLKFFRGKIAAIDIRPFGGDDSGNVVESAGLPKAVSFFEEKFAHKGWMTWGPQFFAPVAKGQMTISDGRIYLSPPCATRSPVPSGACELGARLSIEMKSKCPGDCRIGLFAYTGGKCTRIWSEKFPKSDKFVLRTLETTLPVKADSIRVAVEGRGEYREMKISQRSDPAYSIRATPAYQLTADGNYQAVTFALLKNGVEVDAPQLVVDGLSAYDPVSGAVGCAYVEKGDVEKFQSPASKIAVPSPVNILYIGDSLTHFDLGRNHADKMAYFLNKTNPGMVNLYNYACRGDHIGNVVSRLNNEPKVRFKERYADIWSRKYDWAFVFLGHNDTKASSSKNYAQAVVPPDRQEKLYRELIAKLKQKGVKRIILVSSSSSDFSICEAQTRGRKGVHNRFGDPKHMEAFNAVLKKLAASEKGVEYFDIYETMKSHPAKSTLLRKQDGVHLSDAGNDFVAVETLKYLLRTQPAVKLPSEYFQKW
jgi:lysophospholipase L1-like esterase